MGNTLNLIVGAYAVFNVIYKVATCFNCPDSFFGFKISGLVYVLIWSAAAAAIFYQAYKRWQAEKGLH